jgi:hypothetical protein
MVYDFYLNTCRPCSEMLAGCSGPCNLTISDPYTRVFGTSTSEIDQRVDDLPFDHHVICNGKVTSI